VEHPGVGLLPALVDDARDLGDFATECGLESGAQAADEAQRVDTVADDQLAGAKPLQMETIHLVARQPGHDWHGKSLPGEDGW